MQPSSHNNRGGRGHRGRGGEISASAGRTVANDASALPSNASHPNRLRTETNSNAMHSGADGGRGTRGGRGRGDRREVQVEVNTAHTSQGALGGRGGQRAGARGRGGREPRGVSSSTPEISSAGCSCGNCFESDEDDNDEAVEFPLCEEHLNAFLQMRMMMMGMDPDEGGCDCGECVTPQDLFMSAMMAGMMDNQVDESEADGLIADVEESSEPENDDAGLRRRPLRIGFPTNDDDSDGLPDRLDASDSDTLPDLIDETTIVSNVIGAPDNLPDFEHSTSMPYLVEDSDSMPDLVEDSDSMPNLVDDSDVIRDLNCDSSGSNIPQFVIADSDSDIIPDLISPSDESGDGPRVLEWAIHGGDMLQFLRESQALLLFLREVSSRAPKLGEAFGFSPFTSSFRDVARAVAKSTGSNVHIIREGLLEHGKKVPLFVTVQAAMRGKIVSVEAFERALCRGLEKHFPLDTLVDKVGSRGSGGRIGWVCHGDSLLDVDFTGPSA